MISADRLLSNLGKPTDSPEVQQMLEELGLPDVPELEDGVGDQEAPAHGVALFFSIAHHVRNADGPNAQPPGTPVVSAVMLAASGFAGGRGLPETCLTVSRFPSRERLSGRG